MPGNNPCPRFYGKVKIDSLIKCIETGKILKPLFRMEAYHHGSLSQSLAPSVGLLNSLHVGNYTGSPTITCLLDEWFIYYITTAVCLIIFSACSFHARPMHVEYQWYCVWPHFNRCPLSPWIRRNIFVSYSLLLLH